MSCCQQITINRDGVAHTVTLPVWLPSRGWSLSRKGYVMWTSRGPRFKRGSRLHRIIVETMTGETLPDDVHVHHQDSNPRNCCPLNLIMCPQSFNPRSAIRDPFTGRFLSAREYRRRYARPQQAA